MMKLGLGTTPDHAIAQPASLASDASAEEAARGFLAIYGPLFGRQDPAQVLLLMSARTLDDGRSFVRFMRGRQ